MDLSLNQSTKTQPTDSEPPITAGDLVEIVRLAALLPLSWLVPTRFWPAIAHGFTAADIAIRRKTFDERVSHVGRVLGQAPATAPPRRVVRHWFATNTVDRMQTLRDHRPDRWRPEIEVVGLEHVEAGLAAGRGVVLWVGNFAFSSHVTKMALGRAGLAVSHLSRPTHGFSRSSFGIRALNPIRTRIEDRYLRERLTVTPENAGDIMNVIRGKLGQNGIVSITVGDRARRIARPRFLAGRIRLATGPAYLACSAGAALLPIFTVRTGPRAYTVHIGAPLGKGSSSQDGACVDGIVDAFAARLRPFVLRYPGQWRNWSIVETE